jgi:hypothetical protein
MERVLSVAVGLLLLAVGALLALYGLFAILYRGDSGGDGDTYVTFGSREVDADLAGAVSLVLAALVIAAAVLVLRWARRGYA